MATEPQDPNGPGAPYHPDGLSSEKVADIRELRRNREQVSREAENTTPPRIRRRKLSEIASDPPPAWVLDGVFQARDLVAVYGAPGSGKSFAVTDLMLSLAQGHPAWFGRKISGPARCLYVTLEGHIGRRLTAYAKHHEIALESIQGLEVVEGQLNLLDPASIAELSALMSEFVAEHGGIELVCVDTLARAAPGLMENTAEQMSGLLWEVGQLFREQFNCTILFVHHSGKDEKAGMRGSSVLEGAADSVIRVSNNAGRRSVEVMKVRDGMIGRLGQFDLESVELEAEDFTGQAREAWDGDSEHNSSCVVAPIDRHLEKDEQSKSPTSTEWDLLRLIENAEARRPYSGEIPTSSPNIPHAIQIGLIFDIDPIREAWYAQNGWGDEDETGKERIRKGFQRAVRGLIKKDRLWRHEGVLGLLSTGHE